MQIQKIRGRRTSTRYAVLACSVAAMLAMSACGTRVPTSEILTAEQGSLVTLSPNGGVGDGTVPGDSNGGAVAGGTSGLIPGGTTGGGTTGGTTGGGTTGGTTGGGTTGGTAGGGTTGGTTGGGTTGGTTGGGTTGGTTGGGTTGGTTGGGTAPCTSQGAPLLIGQVTTTSGVIGPDVGTAATVAQVWAKYINSLGGIACHPVQVLTVDDGSDPSKSQSQVMDLVKNKHVQTLMADFVPISIAGFQTAVDQTGIPVVGGDLFSTVWWTDKNFYPVGTYVNANAFGSTAAVAKTGATKVAVLYCIEAAICPPYKDAIVAGSGAGGYKVVYSSQVTITAPDYTSVCQNAKDAGATQISMIVDGSAVSRLARSCLSIGYNVPMAVASLGSTFDKNDANVQKMTVTLASAVAPWFGSTYPGQAVFQKAMKQYAPSFTLDPTSVVAWADGMMLVAAINKLGPSARTEPITTAMIKKGLAMIKNETLDGLVAPTTFSATGGPNPHNTCYYPATFGAGGQYRSLISGYQCQK